MATEDIKEHQFQKGDDPRRNVTGANRGSKWLTTKLEMALTKLGDGNSEPYDDMLIKRVMKKAIVEGDMKAIEHIWNRLEGKPIQPIAGVDGQPIVIQVTNYGDHKPSV